MRASLARACSITVPVSSPVSAAKPTTTMRSLGRSAARPARMSGFWASRMSGELPSSAFLILAAETLTGRKSAGAAAITTASAGRAGLDDVLLQLGGGLHLDDLDAGRVRQGHVGGDEGDLGAAGGRRTGQRVALQPGGPVADEPDGVEVLAGAAGRDDHPLAGEVLDGGAAVLVASGEQVGGQREDLGRVGQPALAGVGAGQAALGGLDHDRAA